MSAVLSQPAPITTRPILRPAYYTRGSMSFGYWYARNEAKVLQHWNELQQFGPLPDSDYFDFAASQYDVALIERKTRDIESQNDEG